MTATAGAILESLRPKQWTKNLVVFAAIVFDGQLFEFHMLFFVALAAILFSLVSSAGYIFNDLRDTEADREHPIKRHRAIPSGRLDSSVAVIVILTIYAIALPLAFFLSPMFAAVLLMYILLMSAYSRWLKHLVIVDVFVIAAGFVLRAVGGAVVVEIPISPWLYVCTILLALFLGFAKRRHELSLLESDATNHRRNLADYSLRLLDNFIIIVASATVIAYSLYTFESRTLPDDRLMLTIPFVLHGVFRYLYLVHQAGVGGAPEQLVLDDKPLFFTVLLWGGAIVGLLYFA
jgi:4-hydroxybenzoate polyprenyltransferase